VRAYASYHTAYCLTYTSGETVVASPPWNERFWGYPMPYLDEVRFHLARRCLDEPGLSVSEIAFRLAYSEKSAFNRAFKRWTGSTPSDHRQGRARR